MPVAVNQDFITFAGDAVSPKFTVLGATSTAVDISTTTGQVTAIQWSMRRNLTDAVALTKTSTIAGQITYSASNGTDGVFNVNLLSTDTVGLSGWYVHTATIFQGSSNPTTVTVGRVNVGSSPNWTYDDGTSMTEDLYLVRGMIGDTLQSDQLLSDQVIAVSLKRYFTREGAAAECCRFIAARFAREVDIVQGQLKTNYSQKSKTYMALAVKLEQLGYARGGATAYVGGTSIVDKDNNVLNTDRVPPQFNIGMFDNTLPESPVGHQTGVGQEFEQDVIISDEGVNL